MSQDDFLLNNNIRGINHNLDQLNNNVNTLHSRLGNINSEIGDINDKQEVLDGKMSTLSGIIDDFIKVDNEKKELQLAETRQGNLKQDLHHKFGYYAEIRRMVLGVLQAVDSGIVSNDVLQNAVETLMVKTPDYWLAPALVALVAWVRDDQEDTEKALNEALRRDDYKTTLFFMLLMRRLGRNEACHQWVQRYLLHQDPYHLDREFVMVLEAAATGSFPPASRELILSTVAQWTDQLTQTDQYINQQKNEWLRFFQSKGELSDQQYPLLEKYCTNWEALKASMRKVRLHQFLLPYFKNILNSPVDYSKTSKNQLDEILSLLITNFDDEELELQKQIKLNQQIVNKKGDKNSADSSYASQEKAFDETTDFLQMLTNAAFVPELTGASHATQSLAVAISNPWISEAHDTYTAEYRMNTMDAELDIEKHKTSSSDGSDETEQLKKHNEYWDGLLNEALKNEGYAGCAIITALFFYGLAGLIYKYRPGFETTSYVMLGIGTFIILILYWSANYNKEKARNKNKEDRIKSQEVLRGCLAELVDFKAEYNKEDAKAEEVRALLRSVSAEELLGNSRDTKAML